MGKFWCTSVSGRASVAQVASGRASVAQVASGRASVAQVASGRASASAGPCAGGQVQVLLHNHMVSWPSVSASTGERAQVLNMMNVNMCKWVASAKTSGREEERVSFQC